MMKNELIGNEVELLLKYADIDWYQLSEEKLPEEFMEKYFDCLEFDCIFENNADTVSIEFIEKHYNDFDRCTLDSLFSYKKLSADFIIRHKDNIRDLYYLSYETLISLPESFLIDNLKSLNIDAIITHGKYSIKLFKEILKIDTGYKYQILGADSVSKEIKEELEEKKPYRFERKIIENDVDLKFETDSIVDIEDLNTVQKLVDEEETSVLERLRKISRDREIFLGDEIVLTKQEIETLKLAIKCGMTYEREIFLGNLAERSLYKEVIKVWSKILLDEYKHGDFYSNIRELNHTLSNEGMIIMSNDHLIDNMKTLYSLVQFYIWELTDCECVLSDITAKEDLFNQIQLIQQNSIGFCSQIKRIIEKL